MVFGKKTIALHLRRLGVRAKTSCLSRFIHLSEHICNKYPNPIQGHQLEGCVVVRQEVKKVSRRDQLCVMIHHDDFKTSSDDFIELYAIKHYLKVTEGVQIISLIIQIQSWLMKRKLPRQSHKWLKTH